MVDMGGYFADGAENGEGIDPLLLDEDKLRRSESLRRRENSFFTSLGIVAGTADGARIFGRMMARAGIGRPLPGDGAALALHNEAIQWLRYLAQVAPGLCSTLLLAALRDGHAE